MLSWESETYQISFIDLNDIEWKDYDFNTDNHYLAGNEYKNNSRLGIKVIFKDEPANQGYLNVLESEGGSTGVHIHCAVRINELIIAYCGDHIFAIEIKTGNLKWKNKADLATCFGVYRFEDKICVRGELEISLYSIEGEKIWSQSGRDIFTTPDGKDDFKIENCKIHVTDWQGYEYVFDEHGHNY